MESINFSQVATQDDTPEVEQDDLINQRRIRSPHDPWARVVFNTERKNVDLKAMPQTEDSKAKLVGLPEAARHVYTLGRRSNSDIRFNLPLISQLHCKIYCTVRNVSNQSNGDITGNISAVWIVDLSSNGTFVNSEKLVKEIPRQLHGSDVVSLINPSLIGGEVSNSKVVYKKEDYDDNSFNILVFANDCYSSTFGDYREESNNNDNEDNKMNSSGINENDNQFKFNKKSQLKRAMSIFNKGSNIYDHYSITKVLGDGATAVVKLAVRKSTGTQYAVKIINYRRSSMMDSFWRIAEDKPYDEKDKEEGFLRILYREAELMRALKHKYIVNLEDVFVDDRNLYFVLEYTPGGDLLERILTKTRYSESEARLVMHQILEAVQYMHSNKIIHRDLKPENILLCFKDSDTDIKISDFGMAKREEDGLKSFVGTVHYFAPEVLSRRDANSQEISEKPNYTLQADIWSIGIILYVLLTGRFPESSSNPTLPNSIRNTLSEECIHFLSTCLEIDPNKRTTASEALLHPWLARSKENTRSKTSRSAESLLVLDSTTSTILITSSTECSTNSDICSNKALDSAEVSQNGATTTDKYAELSDNAKRRPSKRFKGEQIESPSTHDTSSPDKVASKVKRKKT